MAGANLGGYDFDSLPDLSARGGGDVTFDDLPDLTGGKGAKPEKRNLFAYTNDFVIDTANSAAGLAKAGVDLVAPGSAPSRAIEGFIKSGQESQSDWKKAQRRNLQQELQSADGELAKAGTYIKHALTEDPLGLAAEGVGQFGPFRLLGALGLGTKAMMATAGGLSAGEVRGNILDKIQAKSDQELVGLSPEYAQLRQDGMSEQDAKMEVGTKLAQHLPELLATGAIGALGGKYGMEGVAAGTSIAKSRLGAAAISAIDESLQGGVEQLSTNYGVRRTDPKQSLTEDVGLNMAQEGMPGGVVGLMAGGSRRAGADATEPGADDQQPQMGAEFVRQAFTDVGGAGATVDEVATARGMVALSLANMTDDEAATTVERLSGGDQQIASQMMAARQDDALVTAARQQLSNPDAPGGWMAYTTVSHLLRRDAGLVDRIESQPSISVIQQELARYFPTVAGTQVQGPLAPAAANLATGSIPELPPGAPPGIAPEQAQMGQSTAVPPANSAGFIPEPVARRQAEIAAVRDGRKQIAAFGMGETNGLNVSGLAQGPVMGADGLTAFVVARDDSAVQAVATRAAEVGLKQALGEALGYADPTMTAGPQGTAVVQQVDEATGQVIQDEVVSPEKAGEVVRLPGTKARVLPLRHALLERIQQVEAEQRAGLVPPPQAPVVAPAPAVAEVKPANRAQKGAQQLFTAVESVISSMNASNKLEGGEAIDVGSMLPVRPEDMDRNTGQKMSQIQRAAKAAFGVDIVFFSTPKGKLMRKNGQGFTAVNGIADRENGRVFMNVTAATPLNTMAHEFAHIMETQAPEAYARVEEAILSRVSYGALINLRTGLEAAVAAESKGSADAQRVMSELRSELIAEAVGEAGADASLWTDIFRGVGEARSVKDLYDSVMQAIASLAHQFTKVGYIEGIRDMKAVRKAVTDAFVEWSAEVAGKEQQDAVLQQRPEAVDVQERPQVSGQVAVGDQGQAAAGAGQAEAARQEAAPALSRPTVADRIAAGEDVAMEEIVAQPAVHAVYTALEGRRRQAEKLKPEFDKIVEEIAAATGTKPLLADVKSMKRAFEKVWWEYRGATDPAAASKVKDLLRATVQVEDVGDIQAVIDEVLRRFPGATVKRNGWAEGATADPVTGYRDTFFNVTYRGMVVELQANHRVMLKAKDKLHKEYELTREVDGKRPPDTKPWDIPEARWLDQPLRTIYLTALMRQRTGYMAAYFSIIESSAIPEALAMRKNSSLESGAQPSEIGKEDLTTRPPGTSQIAQANSEQQIGTPSQSQNEIDLSASAAIDENLGESSIATSSVSASNTRTDDYTTPARMSRVAIERALRGEPIPPQAVLDETPALLVKHGLKDRLPIAIEGSVIRKVLTGKQGERDVLSIPQLLDLERAIADPVAVFNSASRDDSIVVMTDIVIGGAPVTVAIERDSFRQYQITDINTGKTKRESATANFVNSAYPKTNIEGFESWLKAGRMVFWNGSKTKDAGKFPPTYHLLMARYRNQKPGQQSSRASTPGQGVGPIPTTARQVKPNNASVSIQPVGVNPTTGKAILGLKRKTPLASRVFDMTPDEAAIMSALTEQERSKITRMSLTKIASVLQTLPQTEEMAAVAYAGRAKRGWYKNSADAILALFRADGPRFAALLAAMSPQTSVENNLLNALNTWKNWVAAGRPTERNAIIEIMGQSVQGSNGVDSVLDAWINNSVRALTADDPGTLVISGPKVNSFFKNLVGVVNEVTNDAWMANYAAVDQKIFAGKLNASGTDPGKGSGYLAMSARTRQAAQLLTDLTGDTWTPAEVQETVWSWAKALYETANAAEETRSAVDIVRQRALQDEHIAETPDFHVLFRSGEYANILKEAGYGKRLNSLGRIGQGNRANLVGGTQAQAGPFAERTQQEHELRAAGRLDQLAAQRAADRAATPGVDARLSRVAAPLSDTDGIIRVNGREYPARRADEPYTKDGTKRYMKRAIDTLPAPTSLPFEPERFFSFKPTTQLLPVADIVSSKSDEENQKGGSNAPKRFLAAYDGILQPREAIAVMRDGDQYRVIDGNGTLTAFKAYGWEQIPADIYESEAAFEAAQQGGEMYRAYVLKDSDRRKIAQLFPPTHERVIADHITATAADVGPAKGAIIGTADHEGVQSLVVEVNGKIERSDGIPYHISVSATPGASTGSAGMLIKRLGYDPVPKVQLDLSNGPDYSSPMRSPALSRQALSDDIANRALGATGAGFRFSRAPATDSAEFKAWFGDSKVVDAQGRPLVVMHASTYGDITEFNKAEQRFGKAGFGFYFSDAAGASLFAEYGERFQMDRSAQGEQKAVKIYPVYLSLQNPLVVDHVDDLKPYLDVGQKFGVARGIFGNLPPDAVLRLQKAGYDGIISRETTAPKVHKTQGLKILDRNDPKAVSFPVYVVFEPTQIKSAIGNRGTFDPGNPDIRLSRQVLSEDIANQQLWLQRKAEEAGYETIDDMVDADYDQFVALAEEWRKDHPADVLMSRPLKAASVQEALDMARTGKPRYTLGDAIERGQWADAWMKAKTRQERQGLMRRVGDKLIEVMADSLIAARRWIDALPISTVLKQRMTGDLYRAATLRAAMQKEVKRRYAEPMFRAIEAASKATGLSSDQVKMLSGYWMSAKYAPKANAWLIAKDRTALVAAQQTGDQALIAQAQQNLNERLADVNGAIGARPTRGVAGGFNDAAAARMVADVEAKIPRQLLDDIARPIYDMLAWKRTTDLASGKVNQAIVNSWPSHRDYVPLTGDPRFNPETEDVFTVGNQLNQERDYSINGRKDSVADDGIDAAFESTLKSINFSAIQGFKRSLAQAHADATNAGHNIGVTAEPVTGIVRLGDDVVIYRDSAVNANGVLETRTVAYRFADKRVIEALKRENEEELNAALKALSTPTRWYGKMVTQFMPMFAPVNMIRDLWERSELVRTRKLYDRNGKLINTDKIARQAIAQSINLKLWRASGRHNFELQQKNNDPIRADLEELISLGGSSVWGEYLSRSSGDLEAELRHSYGRIAATWRKAISKVEGYNNTFEMIAPLAIFRALKAANMAAPDAAAAVLDLMNFKKRGTGMPAVKALYVFAQPAATSGYNLMQYLSTTKGRVRFVAQMAIGFALYALLRGTWGDDEDEEVGNRLDNLSNFTVERSIPLPIGGTVVKVPVGFGAPQLAWAGAVTLNRWMNGRYEAADALGEITKSWVKSMSPVQGSDMEIAKYPGQWLAMTFTPTIAKPLMALATGRNAMGAPIRPTFVNEEKWNSEQAMRKTPEIYKQIATEIREMTGIDMFPDTIKTMVDGYLIGPAREIIKMAIENPAREARGEPIQLPLVAQIVDNVNDRRLLDSAYYRYRESVAETNKEYESRLRDGTLADWLTAERLQQVSAYKSMEKVERSLGQMRGRLTKMAGTMDEATRSAQLQQIEAQSDIMRRRLLVTLMSK